MGFTHHLHYSFLLYLYLNSNCEPNFTPSIYNLILLHVFEWKSKFDIFFLFNIFTMHKSHSIFHTLLSSVSRYLASTVGVVCE